MEISSNIVDQDGPAIVRGIKSVGVGKRGSKPISASLAHNIIDDILSEKVSPAAKGAFFGALFIKGLTADEAILEKAFPPGTVTNADQLARELANDAPPHVADICALLLKGQSLDRESAYRLGKFLFSSDPGDGARGLIASVLRVRYETADEYEGLLGAMQDTIEKPFREKVPPGEPIIQLAEPFDGVDNSYLITPLIADHLQSLGFRMISLIGRNSGPKWGNTLLDLIKEMGIQPIPGNTDLKEPKPEFGWYINQENLSKAVDRWVEIRRQTIKRPFLSTLEKFLNPADAKILITSAFHPPYTEKMITLAERAGFAGALVVRSGQEGSLAFPLNRSVKILCSAQKCEGEYTRQELEIKPEETLGREIKVDEKLDKPLLFENARLIKAFKEKGTSGNELFDARVKITCAGIQNAIKWVSDNLNRKA